MNRELDLKKKTDEFMSQQDAWLPVVSSILAKGGSVRIVPRSDGISVLEVKNKQIAFVQSR